MIVTYVFVHVLNYLKMKVWRPIAVLFWRAKMGKGFAPAYVLTNTHAANISLAKMPIQCVKRNGIKLVLQNDGSPIITIIVVESKAMYGATEWGKNGCADLSPNINAKVQAARFFAAVEVVAAGINGTMFVVTAYAISIVIAH